jgi:hypothetical protein
LFPTRFDAGAFCYRGDNGRERARRILITRLLLLGFELVSQPTNDDGDRRYPPGKLSNRKRQPRPRDLLQKTDADRVRVTGVKLGIDTGNTGIESFAPQRICDN